MKSAFSQDRLGRFLAQARRRLSRREAGVVVMILAIAIPLAIYSPGFRTIRNFQNLLDQWAPLGILACAMTLVLIAKGLDLSAGAIFAISGLASALITIATGSALFGVIGACLIGALLGALNAFLILTARINAFIATLATSVVIGGTTLAISKGYLVSVDTPEFAALGSGEFLGLKFSVWILIVWAAALWALLKFTRFGRHIYATGGAEEAARLAGVRIDSVRAITYVVLGFASALAGAIVTSRTLTAQTDADAYGILFDVFTIIIVGGTAIYGGEGGIGRTILGLILLALVTNGFIFLNVPATLQDVFLGVILLMAVGYDSYQKSERRLIRLGKREQLEKEKEDA